VRAPVVDLGVIARPEEEGTVEKDEENGALFGKFVFSENSKDDLNKRIAVISIRNALRVTTEYSSD
jgi:hypothetical protein